MSGNNTPEISRSVNLDQLFGPDVNDGLTDVNSARLFGADIPIAPQIRDASSEETDRHLKVERLLLQEAVIVGDRN
jgi:hypothetical protein